MWALSRCAPFRRIPLRRTRRRGRPGPVAAAVISGAFSPTSAEAEATPVFGADGHHWEIWHALRHDRPSTTAAIRYGGLRRPSCL